MKKITITSIIGIVTLIGLIFAFDDRYAKAVDQQQVIQSIQRTNDRITIGTLYDKKERLQKRIYNLESNYLDELTMPKVIKDECLNLKLEIERVEQQIKQYEVR